MRLAKPLVVGVAAVAVAAVTAIFTPRLGDRRSVRLSSPSETIAPARFDPAQSAALFIGVRKNTKDDVVDIPYAVDDAVDLAWAFALDSRVRLVRPERVVLALSGKPQKSESQRKLEELVQAGARVQPADQSTILSLLQEQAAAAGPEGMFILSLASHGFVREGLPYVLASTSIVRYPDTALSMATIFDTIATTHPERSLLFIDACRERITAGRNVDSDPQTAAPLLDQMKRIRGQVVFYAATQGGYAYDADGNGVFTKAVLDGLNCQATSKGGVITAGALHVFVERSVKRWIRTHRDAAIGAATQISLDGDTRNMPLARCEAAPPPPGESDTATVRGTAVSAIDKDGKLLWTRDLGEHVLQAAVFKDKRLPEVIVLSASRLFVLRNDGEGAATFDDGTNRLLGFAIDRPTARHKRRIIVSSSRGVFLTDGKKTLWRGIVTPSTDGIEHMEILDHDNDTQRDIALRTASGNRLFLDFEGALIDFRRAADGPSPRFTIVPPRRAASTSPQALPSDR